MTISVQNLLGAAEVLLSLALMAVLVRLHLGARRLRASQRKPEIDPERLDQVIWPDEIDTSSSSLMGRRRP